MQRLGTSTPVALAYPRAFLAEGHPVFGDRKSEVTVIGTARDRTIFLRELRACLCTEEEISRWRQEGDACGLLDPWLKKLRRVGT